MRLPSNRSSLNWSHSCPRTKLAQTRSVVVCHAHDKTIDKREKAIYRDSWTDIAFIAMCRKAYGSLAGWQSPRGWTRGEETFAGMVEVSRALMRGRSAEQQRDAVIAGFPKVPAWFRSVFPYSKWGAEVNATITPAFFTWLVGPMKTIEVEIRQSNGKTVLQKSGVQIERCRYLEESGCAAMCVNLCKSPCQTFFTEQLGMPLTMEPNFEDSSCKVTNEYTIFDFVKSLDTKD